jgi:ketosteroid isomerase-like protein
MRGNEHTDLLRRHLLALEARDWEGFAATLHPDVVHEVPQTRERVTGRAAYLRHSRRDRGDWHLSVRRVVADEAGGLAWTEVSLGGELLAGLHVFTITDGLVSRVDDFWPEPADLQAGLGHLLEGS